MRIVCAQLLAVIALSSPAIAQKLTRKSPAATVPAPVRLDNTGKFQDAFARVGDDLFIAGQPTADALRELRSRGVTTVVNLRSPKEMAGIGFDEEALVKSLGMKYVYLPVRGTPDMPYSPATVTSFAEALRDANGPVLLHCTVAWRASHLWGAYLIANRGMLVDSALAQARVVNLMDEHHIATGRQPIEDFLGRDLKELKANHSP